MTAPFNSYQDYLEKSTSPYIKSEKQFNKELKQKQEETLPTKIFNEIFQKVDKIVPDRLKGMGSMIKISFLLASSYFKNQSNFNKCVYLTGVVSATVFFCPQPFSKLDLHQLSYCLIPVHNKSY